VSPILIVTICSDRKMPGGSNCRYDDSPLRRTWSPDEQRNLLAKRRWALELLRTTPEIRDGRRVRDIPCNKALRDGGDFGGTADAPYLPAIERYSGRFYASLGDPDSRLEMVRRSEHHLLILSGLYGLLTPDELNQDYSCHITDDSRIREVWTRGSYLTSMLLAYVRHHRIERVFDLTGDEDYRCLIRWNEEVAQRIPVLHAFSSRRYSEKTLPALGCFARQCLLPATPQKLMALQEGQTFPCEDDKILITEKDSPLPPPPPPPPPPRMVPAWPWPGASSPKSQCSTPSGKVWIRVIPFTIMLPGKCLAAAGGCATGKRTLSSPMSAEGF